MAIRNDRNDNEIEQEIVKLYRTYVQEWQNSAIFIQDDMTNDRNHEQYLEDKRWHQMQLIN